MLLGTSSLDNMKENIPLIVGKIAETSKNDLIHYIASRRNILDIFEKSLETDEDGKYKAEAIIHDIIFPRYGDSDVTVFEDHNLWLIDERLNFTNYVTSEHYLDSDNNDRTDLLVNHHAVTFRGENEASNPITIFEFKKPQRDDFVNLSHKEDPVEQIKRYVNKIRIGDCKTPQGRKMIVAPNTPFYGYVVCDLTQKVEDWLYYQKNFKPMPDKLGWFDWFQNINLYVEVLSWEKVLKDANLRNGMFFYKLGI